MNTFMDFHRPPKYFANQDFSRSTSMHYNQHSPQFSRFLSNDNDPFFMQNRNHLSNTFRHMTIHPNDGDDEDEDDDGKTPTIDQPSLKYPKQ
jgi:hypothetical protein